MQLTNDDIDILYQIKHYVEAHIHERIPIEKLSRLAGMGENKLTRGFKFLFQYSISQYHLFISMEYARAMLEDKNLTPVKEVAMRLGYTSTSHFSRAFTRIFTNSPVEFRVL